VPGLGGATSPQIGRERSSTEPSRICPNILKLTEEDKEKKITQMIVGSPLAFLTYVESYVWERNSYRVLVPGESYLPMLHDNVWISGKLNFVG
jgi:hypothetical protein